MAIAFPEIMPATDTGRVLKRAADNQIFKEVLNDQGNLGYCLKLGSLLSRKACLPSCASSIK